MVEDALHPLEAARRQRLIIIRILRMAFAILIVTVAVLPSALQSTVSLAIPWWFPVAVAAVLFAVALAVDRLTPNKKISAISGVFLGLLGGMVATLALGFIIDLLVHTAIDDPAIVAKVTPFVGTLKFMLGIALCYLGISTVLQTQDDFRLVIPYVEFSKQIRGPKPLILDTSALIDARIADVVGTGIVQAPLVIPRFVIAELQLLADSSDKLKRARGRRGLDVTTRLQRSALDVTIDETPVPGKAVDQMLVELARQMPATVVTTDIGLARVAQIQSVSVLNLNDVANALKPSLVPGEQLSLRLIKPGEQAGQGVGYLDDGTMVVVENGAALIGEEASVLVTSTLQTSAGRLIFARVAGEAPGAPEAAGALASPPAAQAEQAVLPPLPGPGDGPVRAGEPVATNGAAGEETPAAAAGAVAVPPARHAGPFPPKPARSPNPARNPRR
jgi:uncharacterized protein YacL